MICLIIKKKMLTLNKNPVGGGRGEKYLIEITHKKYRIMKV